MWRVVAKKEEINLTYPESKDLHRRLIETVRSGIFLTGPEAKLTYVNPAFVEMIGYGVKDDVVGLKLPELLFSEQEERDAFLARMKEVGFVREFEARHAHRDGTARVFSITTNHIYDDRGHVIGSEGVVHDVTEKKKLEEELTVEKKKMEQILAFDEEIATIREYDKLIDFVVQRVSTILEVGKCSLMLLNKSGKELFIEGSKGINTTVAKECRVRLGDPIAGQVAQTRMPVLVKNIEYDQRFQRANKVSYLSRSFISVPVILEYKLIGVINVTDKLKDKNFDEVDLRILGAISREVAVAIENVRLYKELSTLTVTDPLTLIYNYRQFSRSLGYEIKRHQRVAADLCLMMMDIDNFKLYNDTFGHLEGDALLKEIGATLKSHLRGTDIVCRYAGDEFAVILPGITVEGAKVAAEKIRKAIEEKPFKMKASISIGIAHYTDGLTEYEFILKADRALYKAKQAGKNQVHAEK